MPPPNPRDLLIFSTAAQLASLGRAAEARSALDSLDASLAADPDPPLELRAAVRAMRAEVLLAMGEFGLAMGVLDGLLAEDGHGVGAVGRERLRFQRGCAAYALSKLGDVDDSVLETAVEDFDAVLGPRQDRQVEGLAAALAGLSAAAGFSAPVMGMGGPMGAMGLGAGMGMGMGMDPMSAAMGFPGGGDPFSTSDPFAPPSSPVSDRERVMAAGLRGLLTLRLGRPGAEADLRTFAGMKGVFEGVEGGMGGTAGRVGKEVDEALALIGGM